MGAGKTTVGKALAKALNLQFYDLDWYIENRMHMTVSRSSMSAARRDSGK